MNDFIARIKQPSLDCDFGENLEEHIRDRILWGLSYEQTLNYKQAIQIITSMDMAKREAEVMGSNGSSSVVLTRGQDGDKTRF